MNWAIHLITALQIRRTESIAVLVSHNPWIAGTVTSPETGECNSDHVISSSNKCKGTCVNRQLRANKQKGYTTLEAAVLWVIFRPKKKRGKVWLTATPLLQIHEQEPCGRTCRSRWMPQKLKEGGFLWQQLLVSWGPGSEVIIGI